MIIDLVKKSKSSAIWRFIIKNLCKLNFENFLRPKIFLANLNKIEVNDDSFYSYVQNFPKTKWKMNNNAYQSNHDLQNNKEFSKVKLQIENFLNQNIKEYFLPNNSKGKFVLKSMWFVIMKQNTSHHTHTHPKSVLSGVIYIKKSQSNDGKIKILIPNFNKEKYAEKELTNFVHEKTILVNFKKADFDKNYINNSYFEFNPEKNDMIIFNSYLYHSVGNYLDEEDRISLAWDAVYSF